MTLAAALALAAALTGCGKAAPDPTPSPSASTSSPTTTTSASPAPSPTPTPPPKPATWTSNDDAGALAAAQYFMDLYNYAIATGDLTEWKTLSAPECEFCSNVASNVSGLYGSGGRFEGGDTTVRSVDFDSHDEVLGLYAVRLEVSTSEMRRLAASGELERTTPAGAFVALADLEFIDAQWRLSGLTVTSDGS